MSDRSTALAAAAILTAGVSVSLGAALGKGLFPQVGPEGVAAMRSMIAAPLLVMVLRPWRVRISRPQWGWIVLYGLILGVMNLCIYWAIQRIPIGLGVTIEISGPLAVVLLTSRSLRDLWWFALAAGGLLLLMPWQVSAHQLDPVGILFALAAGACWGLYILVGKRAADGSGTATVALGMCVACGVTLPFGLATAGSALFGPALKLGVVVAILSSALPYLLEITALRRLSSRVFGVITSSDPAIAALLGWLVLAEHLTPLQMLAVAMVITASAGCAITSRPPLARAEEAALS